MCAVVETNNAFSKSTTGSVSALGSEPATSLLSPCARGSETATAGSTVLVSSAASCASEGVLVVLLGVPKAEPGGVVSVATVGLGGWASSSGWGNVMTIPSC